MKNYHYENPFEKNIIFVDDQSKIIYEKRLL